MLVNHVVCFGDTHHDDFDYASKVRSFRSNIQEQAEVFGAPCLFPFFSIPCKSKKQMPTIPLDAHIVSTPGIMGGEPRLRGRRIRVKDIVMWYEYCGRSADEISAHFGIGLAEVYVALAYYHAHGSALRARWAEQKQFLNQLKSQIKTKL
jgi:uncharacterized protein (DUF433 family)